MTIKQRILNVGIIGAGAFMARQHLPNIARDPLYRIHTLCDLRKEILEDIAKQYPCLPRLWRGNLPDCRITGNTEH